MYKKCKYFPAYYIFAHLKNVIKQFLKSNNSLFIVYAHCTDVSLCFSVRLVHCGNWWVGVEQRTLLTLIDITV